MPEETFGPRESLDSPERQNLRAKVQAQVDELNVLLEQYSGTGKNADAPQLP